MGANFKAVDLTVGQFANYDGGMGRRTLTQRSDASWRRPRSCY